jgi:hypothetical protein
MLRGVITAAMAVSGILAFLGMGLGQAGPLNPIGIGMMIGAVLVWYGWPGGFSRTKRPAGHDHPGFMTALFIADFPHRSADNPPEP